MNNYKRNISLFVTMLMICVLIFATSAFAMDLSVFSDDIYSIEIDEMDDSGAISVDVGLKVSFETEAEDVSPLIMPSISLLVTGEDAITILDIFMLGAATNAESVIIKTEEARYTFTNPVVETMQSSENVRIALSSKEAFNLIKDLSSDTEEAAIRIVGKDKSLDGTITVDKDKCNQFYNDYVSGGGLNQALMFSQFSSAYPCEIKQLKESDDPIDIHSQSVVMLVQQTLNDLGYSCGTPDGSAGPATTGAISSYQQASGMEVTGTITEELIASLGIKTEAQELSKKESEKTNYESYSYDQLARNPETYIGSLVVVSGKIIQTSEDGTDGMLRVAVNDNYDTVVMVMYNTNQLAYRLLEDDYVTIYGVSAGVVSYQSVMGGTITIPGIVADIIEKN